MFDTGFIDSYFSRNYIGATNNSIIRGAYHFARPSVSNGAAQAQYFLAHGGKAHTLVPCVFSHTTVTGGWTGDGITLPGAVDLEGISNLLIIRKKSISHSKWLYSYSGNCSGLSASQMVAWIKDFSNTYHSRTKRYCNSTSFPLLFTLTDTSSLDIQVCCFLCFLAIVGLTSGIPSDLCHHKLVGPVHWQQRLFRLDEPTVDC
jgi:Glycosyl hydrolases family 25